MRDDECEEVKTLPCFEWKDLFHSLKYSNLLGVLKHQSNVNLYLSSSQGEKVCFNTHICKMENAAKCMEEALDSLNICRERREMIILQGDQERAV